MDRQGSFAVLVQHAAAAHHRAAARGVAGALHGEARRAGIGAAEKGDREKGDADCKARREASKKATGAQYFDPGIIAAMLPQTQRTREDPDSLAPTSGKSGSSGVPSDTGVCDG